MKAYKGFNKDLTCRGYQFEVGKTYEEEKAELCLSGFHACENPMDCLSYYAPNESVYHAVELDGVDDKRKEDSKVCAKRITIGAQLDFGGIVKAAVSFVHERVNATTGDRAHAATTGYWAHAEVSGSNSIAAALGAEAKAKAALGCWIVCAEYAPDGLLLAVKAAKVDGVSIRPDVWYKLSGGKFAEVEA